MRERAGFVGPPSSTRQWLLVVAAIGLVAVGLAFVGGVELLAGDGSDSSTNETPSAAVVDIEGGETVTVTYATSSGHQDSFVTSTDPERADIDSGWAFVNRSSLPPALAEVEGDPTAGVVAVGELALVGAVEFDTQQAGDMEITVVSPAEHEVDPGHKAHFLATYLAPYSLGQERSELTLVAAPGIFPHRGAMYGDGTGYVTVQGFWDGDVGSVWLHEAVHAYQEYSLEAEMAWFDEASAEYLSFRILQEQYDEVTDDDVTARLDALPEYPDAVLANASTWEGENVDYVRGVRLLYAIDKAVRNGSDGEDTLFDVFRSMNEYNGSISLDEFETIVEHHSGEEEVWIREAVTTTGQLPVPDDTDDVFS